MKTPALAALVAAFLLAAPAFAQGPPCGPRDQVIKELANRYNEAPRATGVGSMGGTVTIILEVFASPTGSFTIFYTRPDGLSCLLFSGESYDEKPKGSGI